MKCPLNAFHVHVRSCTLLVSRVTWKSVETGISAYPQAEWTTLERLQVIEIMYPGGKTVLLYCVVSELWMHGTVWLYHLSFLYMCRFVLARLVAPHLVSMEECLVLMGSLFWDMDTKEHSTCGRMYPLRYWVCLLLDNAGKHKNGRTEPLFSFSQTSTHVTI